MSERRWKRYTPEQRGELLDLYKKSGLRASRFCRQQSLSYPALRQWLGAGPDNAVGLVEGWGGRVST